MTSPINLTENAFQISIIFFLFKFNVSLFLSHFESIQSKFFATLNYSAYFPFSRAFSASLRASVHHMFVFIEQVGNIACHVNQTMTAVLVCQKIFSFCWCVQRKYTFQKWTKGKNLILIRMNISTTTSNKNGLLFCGFNQDQGSWKMDLYKYSMVDWYHGQDLLGLAT